VVNFLWEEEVEKKRPNYHSNRRHIAVPQLYSTYSVTNWYFKEEEERGWFKMKRFYEYKSVMSSLSALKLGVSIFFGK